MFGIWQNMSFIAFLNVNYFGQIVLDEDHLEIMLDELFKTQMLNHVGRISC